MRLETTPMTSTQTIQLGDRVIHTSGMGSGIVIGGSVSRVIVRWDSGFPSVSVEHPERLRRDFGR